MGVKRVIDSANYIKAGDDGADGAATFDFPAVEVLHVDKVSFEITNTGCVGTMQLQESNSGVVFTDSTTNAAITAGTTDFISLDTAAKFVRLRFVRTSGSGLITAHLVAKSVSG